MKHRIRRASPESARRPTLPASQRVTAGKITAFVVSATLIWALLVWDWSGFRNLYARSYAQVASDVFGSTMNSAIRFLPKPTEAAGMVEMRCTNHLTRQQFSKVQNTRLLAYLPTAGVLALCLATPLPFLCRLRRTLVGLLLVHLFLLARVGIAAVYLLSFGDSQAVMPLSTWLRKAVEGAQFVLVTGLPIGFIAPVFIWLLAMIRPSEWTFARSPRTGEVARLANTPSQTA